MPNITLSRNDNPRSLQKPGIIITGKGRNTVRAELEGTGLAFRAKFLDGFDKNISRLIIVADESYKEALKYVLLAETENIPHVLITTAVTSNYSIKFLHIVYTEEQCLVAAVKTAVDEEELCGIPESYLLSAEADGEHRLEAVFADIFDRLPSFDFSNLLMRIYAHPSENLERSYMKKYLPKLTLQRIDSDKLHRISAEIIGF
jgi:hypothetical protein